VVLHHYHRQVEVLEVVEHRQTLRQHFDQATAVLVEPTCCKINVEVNR
jgi:hypothetical protein